MRLLKQQSLARLGAGVSALLMFGAVMGWMLWRALHDKRPGDLALFYQPLTEAELDALVVGKCGPDLHS